MIDRLLHSEIYLSGISEASENNKSILLTIMILKDCGMLVQGSRAAGPRSWRKYVLWRSGRFWEGVDVSWKTG